MSHDLVVARVGGLDAEALDAADPPTMDEDAFRGFYERTSRSVWAYLAHVTGDPNAADDLLQDAYYRFLQVRCRWESEAHRRNYLFKIATNLARDRHRRRAGREVVSLDVETAAAAGAEIDTERLAARRADLRRALARLSARERELVWLAYAEGSSHQEIAEMLGLRATGIRVLLFRARRKLAAFLRGARS